MSRGGEAEGWVAGGFAGGVAHRRESGAGVVPGKPEESLLIRSITHAGPDLKMPKKAPKLGEGKIADLV